MNPTTADLYGVKRDRQALLDRVQGPYFAAWWQHFLAQQEEQVNQPIYPPIAGLEEMTAEAAYAARHRRLGSASADRLSLGFAYALTGEERTSEQQQEQRGSSHAHASITSTPVGTGCGQASSSLGDQSRFTARRPSPTGSTGTEGRDRRIQSKPNGPSRKTAVVHSFTSRSVPQRSRADLRARQAQSAARYSKRA